VKINHVNTYRLRPVQIVLLFVCIGVAGFAPVVDRWTTEMFVGSVVVGALCAVWIFETSVLSQQE
jgi:hypothetical protein